MAWKDTSTLEPKKFDCGFCGRAVASNVGFMRDGKYRDARGGTATRYAYSYICPHCENPSYFAWDRKQTPGVSPGNDVEHMPQDIADLYGEARSAAGAGAHTASVLACRKLLMNIAVNHGAEAGESFMKYIEFLSEKNFVPPGGKSWVDHIRTKGNEATHEIKVMTPQDSSDLISFAEMLLKFIYEFPARVPKPSAAPSAP